MNQPTLTLQKRVIIFYWEMQLHVKRYSRYFFPMAIVLSLIVFSWVLIAHEKWEYLGGLFFTAATASCAYQALIYTREKFRLELFEKRIALFEPVQIFCDAVHKGDVEIRKSGTDLEVVLTSLESGDLSAMKLYEKIDEFKLAALFDSEVSGMGHAIYDAIFNLEYIVKDPAHQKDLIKYFKESAWKWPLLFMPYIYFGDYKRNIVPE